MSRLTDALRPRLRGSARRAVEEALADCEVEQRRARSTRARLVGMVSGVIAVMRALAASIVTFDAPFREGFMDRLMSDARYAARRLYRTPGFTAIAVVTLALGIGANTALFSLVNGLLFKSIPIAHLDRLVTLAEVDRSTGRVFISISDDKRRAIAESAAPMIGQIVLSDPLVGALTGRDGADFVSGELVTGNYFQVMGVTPRAGRLLEPGDDQEHGTDTPVVISERLWRRRFGASLSAIGESIKIADHPLVIVGVAPDFFQGTWLPTILTADVWVPIAAQTMVATLQGASPHNDHRTFATLRPTASLSQLNAAVDVIGQQFPLRPGTHLAALPGRDGIMLPEFNHYGVLLGAAVLALSTLVFLIACANLTNLLLARGAARAGEMAIRMATGAGRGRIFQLFLTEIALLTALSGLVGLALAFATTRLMTMVSIPSVDGITVRFDPSPDLRVFGFAFAVAVLASLAVGVVPAWRASRTEPLRVLASGGAGSGATGRGHRLRTILVASQVAMSTLLLIGAGLYVHSAIRGLNYDPGYDVSSAAIAQVDLRYTKLDEAHGRLLYRRMLDEARTMPGVQHAALVTSVPGALRSAVGAYILPEGFPPPPNRSPGYFVSLSAVSPGFFDTVGIRLRAGRDFNDGDVQTARPVAIISEFGAAKFWPGQDPIGKRLQTAKDGPFIEIVGVASNTRTGFSGDVPRSFVFLPLAQHYDTGVGLVVRAVSPAAIIEPLRAAIRRADENLPVLGVSTLAEYVGFILTPIRLTALVLGALGVLGFAIAVLGLHGVMSFVVSQRTREFGIRKAIGAGAGDLYRIVLGQGVRMLLWGVVPGLAAAFLGAGYLRALLYGIEARDPWTFFIVPAALITVGLIASFTPARRAARIDPNVALREM